MEQRGQSVFQEAIKTPDAPHPIHLGESRRKKNGETKQTSLSIAPRSSGHLNVSYGREHTRAISFECSLPATHHFLPRQSYCSKWLCTQFYYWAVFHLGLRKMPHVGTLRNLTLFTTGSGLKSQSQIQGYKKSNFLPLFYHQLHSVRQEKHDYNPCMFHKSITRANTETVFTVRCTKHFN